MRDDAALRIIRGLDKMADVIYPANFFGRTARFSDFLPRICNEMEKI